jgi:peptidoglycan/LPS O-acetylase OafA/YrhL
MVNAGEVNYHKSVKKIYFPDLNGVRGIAALLVVIGHIELEKRSAGLNTISYLATNGIGKLGVIVFFALSGFLITYLLLEEKNQFGNINYGKFYVRRLLRIMPLYLLVVLFGFFIYPAQGSVKALLLSVLLLPNLAFTLRILPALFDPIWSVGTEMQFYFLQPQFFRLETKKQLFISLMLFFTMYSAAFVLIKHFQYHSKLLIAARDFLYYARLDNLSVAAMITVIYYTYRQQSIPVLIRAFRFVFSRISQWILLMMFCGFAGFYITSSFIGIETIISIIVSLLLINLCETKTSVYHLHHKWLNYIGEISYSVYLLHKFAIHLVVGLIKYSHPALSPLATNVVIYSCSISLSLVLATFSYYGYERYFLRLKLKFAKVDDNRRS